MATKEQRLEDQKRKTMGTTLSRLFGRRKNLVMDGAEGGPQEVPGSLGSTLRSILGLLRLGHNYYRKKRKENNSNIFKMNVYQPRIVLCSYDGLRHIYESPYVSKEPGFGMMAFNFECLGNHTPLIFQNGELHDDRRKIFIELSKSLFCNETFIDTLYDVTGTEMKAVSEKFTKNTNLEFETMMAEAVGNVIFESIVGTRVQYHLLKAWIDNCLIKKFKKADPSTPAVFEKIKDCIKSSANFKKICDHVINEAKVDVTDSTICNELVFSLIFNAHAALHSMASSSLAHLTKLSTEDLNLLKDEAVRFHQSSNKTNELDNLPYIESFVMEMLRLFPPATFVFRRVTQNFVISLSSGSYQIKKGDQLCGNVYLCQRDPDIFENPDEIDIHRYKNSPHLKEYLTCFGANFTQENTPEIQKCAGQKLAMTIAKILIVHSLFFDMEFSGKVIWTGNKIKRVAGIDKPLKVKRVNYNSDTVKIVK